MRNRMERKETRRTSHSSMSHLMIYGNKRREKVLLLDESVFGFG